MKILRTVLPVTLLAVASVAPARAQLTTPALVANLNRGGAQHQGVVFDLFANLGGQVLFSAGKEPEGYELWTSDGTSQGTRLVKDLCPYPFCDGWPRLMGTTASRAFLSAEDGSGSRQLWVSDGTNGGTRVLTSFTAWRTQDLEHHLLHPATGKLFFRNTDPWVSDGTLAGTFRLAELLGPGPIALGDLPRDFTAAGTSAFFTAGGSTRIRELWVSDGSRSGTRLVRHFPSDGVGPLAGAGSKLIFGASSPGSGYEPWVSDGTEAGTQVLRELVPGDAGADRIAMLAFPGAVPRVLFSATVGDHHELWVTDGSPAGTSSLASLSGELNSAGGPPVVLAGRLVFKVFRSNVSAEVWSTDGTPSGTQMIAPACTGCFDLAESPFRLADDLALFASQGLAGGTELWRTDGTPLGTVRVKDICPGACSSQPSGGWRLGHSVVFRTQAGNVATALWRSDGTEVGTFAITDLEPDRGVRSAIEGSGGKLLLTMRRPEGFYDLWATDGTPGSLELIELRPVSLDWGSEPSLFAPVGDSLVFWAQTAESSGQLFATDASGGAAPLTSFDPSMRYGAAASGAAQGHPLYFLGSETTGSELWSVHGAPPAASKVTSLGPFDSVLGIVGGQTAYFVRSGTPSAPSDLWMTDGTAPGTRRVATAVGPTTNAAIYETAVLGSDLFFIGAGGDLFRTNGTAAGTVRVKDFPGPTLIDAQMARVGDRVFFAVNGVLWRTDGTEAGTVMVDDIGGGQLAFWFLRELNGALVFRAFRAETGFELWRSDGTPEGTRLLRDIRPGPASSYSYLLLRAENQIFFVGNDGEHGEELWVTDGTSEGTRMVTDLAAGPASSSPFPLQPVGDGRLAFSASDGASGDELWITDGTLFGTWLLADLAPGPRSSTPYSPALVGDQLFFTADDGVIGRELWKLTLPAVEEPCASARDLCLRSGRIRVRVAWRDPRTGAEGVGTAVPFSDQTGFFWFFNPSNIELVAKVLDGTAINEHFWTFYGALTDVEYFIEVTDLASGRSRTYHNPPRNICGVGDTTSIPLGASSATATGTHFELLAELEAEPPVLAGEEALPPKAAGGCIPSARTLCLAGGRFAVDVDWRNHRTGETGVGTAVPGLDPSGYFWFFNPGNIELVVKLLDGLAVNGRYWFFYGALSDVEYTIKVTDTTTGATRTYVNQPGNICGRADVDAFVP